MEDDKNEPKMSIEGVKEVECMTDLEEITKNNAKVFVYCYGNWCKPCEIIIPEIKNHIKNFPEITFVQSDMDRAIDIYRKFGVHVMPTFLLFENNEIYKRFDGAHKQRVLDRLTRFAKKGPREPNEEITRVEELDDVLKAHKKMIFHFTDSWSFSTIVFQPEVNEILEKYRKEHGDLGYYQFEAGDNIRIHKRYMISKIPTFLYLVDGKSAERTEGALPDEINRNIKEIFIDGKYRPELDEPYKSCFHEHVLIRRPGKITCSVCRLEEDFYNYCFDCDFKLCKPCREHEMDGYTWKNHPDHKIFCEVRENAKCSDCERTGVTNCMVCREKDCGYILCINCYKKCIDDIREEERKKKEEEERKIREAEEEKRKKEEEEKKKKEEENF